MADAATDSESRNVVQGHINPAFDDICTIDGEDLDGGTGSTRSVASEYHNGTEVVVQQNHHHETGVDAPPSTTTASPSERKPAVVCVRGAHKAYRSGNPVLTGYNMTVEKGTIYGLLGSSGCGKTTILSCIVGLRRLDSGVIHVFGNRPGTSGSGVPGRNVGYMPQEISLYGDFTINETLEYFGSLYCMKKSDIDKNRDWLIDFLELPNPKRKVGALSGGQKRRVSIAVAMIHDPKLLILDEPTVGVDPLLRESIWEHLVERVTKHDTTVIITTHYIEEARQAHTVGLMRNGKLLAEKPPEALMAEHGVSFLEDVVLRLCRVDADEGSASVASEVNAVKKKKVETVKEKGALTSCPPMAKILDGTDQNATVDSMKRVAALVKKNAMVMMRNYLLLIFIVWLPACQVLFLCIAIGNDPKLLNFGIVNHEFEASGVNNCGDLLEMRKNETCKLKGLSCEFLRMLPDDVMYQKFYATEDEARYDVERGNTWGFISFPREFSEAYYTKLTSSALADDATLNGSSISMELDETSKQISGTLKKQLADSFKNFTKALLKECGYSENLAEVPLQIVDPIYGSDDTDTREFMSFGIMLAILFFFPLITAGVQNVYEKKLGTLDRTLVAGVKTWEIMTGFSITTFTVLFVQTMLALVIITVLYEIQVHGSFVLCMIIGILTGLGGVSMGFLIGSICKEEIEATMLSSGLFIPVVTLSGIFWPVEGMPPALRYVSYLLQINLPAEALRSIVSRGWCFSHPHVWPGIASINAWIIFYWALTLLLHKTNLTR